MLNSLHRQTIKQTSGSVSALEPEVIEHLENAANVHADETPSNFYVRSHTSNNETVPICPGSRSPKLAKGGGLCNESAHSTLGRIYARCHANNIRSSIHGGQTMIHPLADVKSQTIGIGTRIWQFCVVFEQARIGANCNICANVLIENDVVIGDNVTIKSGVQLWNGVRIEDHVFIGPNATFTNDSMPRSKVYPERFLQTIVKAGASIGANATILPGVTIAEGAMVGAGAVVTRSVPPNAIVMGNPARITGYTNTIVEANSKLPQFKEERKAPYADSTQVLGVTIHKFPLILDMRGNLTVGEFERHIPFIPMRYFMVFNVPSKETRGEHAHRQCHQFLICVRGSCAVLADDGINRTEVLLDSPDKGIYLPPMVWGVQYKYSADALLLVFASHHYDAGDYIRNYEQFIVATRATNH